MVCKYFLLVWGLFFSPLNRDFCIAKKINLMQASLSNFPFMDYEFCVKSKNSLTYPRFWRFSPMFLSKIFIVLCFTLEFNFLNNYRTIWIIFYIGWVATVFFDELARFICVVKFVLIEYFLFLLMSIGSITITPGSFMVLLICTFSFFLFQSS